MVMVVVVVVVVVVAAGCCCNRQCLASLLWLKSVIQVVLGCRRYLLINFNFAVACSRLRFYTCGWLCVFCCVSNYSLSFARCYVFAVSFVAFALYSLLSFAYAFGFLCCLSSVRACAQGRGFIKKGVLEKNLRKAERESGGSALLDQKRWSELAWDGERAGEGGEKGRGLGAGAAWGVRGILVGILLLVLVVVLALVSVLVVVVL